MEVGQGPIATFTSHLSFPDTHALSTLYCAGGRSGAVMARHKHIGVGDAKVRLLPFSIDTQSLDSSWLTLTFLP